MNEVVKERATMGLMAARRAAATAERCRNMIVATVDARRMAMALTGGLSRDL